MLAQALARKENFVERVDLEGEMVQLALLGGSRHSADERDAVMIRVVAHEHHATGDHRLRIDIGDGEAQHVHVEVDRLV